MIKKKLVEQVVEVRRKSDRIMSVKLVVDSEIFNVVSSYAPQIELDGETKRRFWEDLDEVIQNIPQTGKLFIGGDFNGHIGRRGDGYESVHGGFGYGERNNGGVSFLDFAVSYELVIVNSYFKKKDEHLITFKSGSTRTKIDYFLMRSNDRRMCRDSKVIPSECLTTQHRLLVVDVEIRKAIRSRKTIGVYRIKC